MSLKDRLSKTTSQIPANALGSNARNSGIDFAQYQDLKGQLHLLLIEKINTIATWEELSDVDQNQLIKQFIEQRITQTFNSIPLSKAEKDRIVREIRQEVRGFGPLDPLLADPTISDILVNGPHKVYIEVAGKLKLTNVKFKDEAHLQNIIERIVSKVGRRIDEKSPMVDARLPDGSRVNAIIPPLSIDGASLSIRRFKADAATLQNLLSWGSMTTAMADALKIAVKIKLNIIISGGTGSGKTTLLNSLSSQIPKGERIVTIEDSAELALQQDHVVRLETRPASIEGTGAVTARDLLINSLRMRPDRIVIGECRGAESLDMLQAMNTGHDGSLTTLHANTPRDACSRLETMCLFAGIDLPEKTLRNQITSAVHLIIKASRLNDGSRRITCISEITGMEGDIITMQDIFKWEQYGIDDKGRIIGAHIATGVRPKFAEKAKAQGLDFPVHLFDSNTPPEYLCKNPPNEKAQSAKKMNDFDKKDVLGEIMKQRKINKVNK